MLTSSSVVEMKEEARTVTMLANPDSFKVFSFTVQMSKSVC